MEGYPEQMPISVRWRDLDPLGHVNNAVLISYLEMARVVFWQRHAPWGRPQDVSFVIAKLSVDYKRPIQLGQEVVVGLRLGRVGRSSFAFDYRIEAAGRLAAEASTVQVHLDPSTKQPASLPEQMLRVLRQADPAQVTTAAAASDGEAQA